MQQFSDLPTRLVVRIRPRLRLRAPDSPKITRFNSTLGFGTMPRADAENERSRFTNG